MQAYVDIPVNSSRLDYIRVCPQVPYDKEFSVIGIWGVEPSSRSQDGVFLTDKEVDDLITVLEFYKQEKITKGTWYGVS